MMLQSADRKIAGDASAYSRLPDATQHAGRMAIVLRFQGPGSEVFLS